MGFIIRSAFWLGVVAVVLPSEPKPEPPKADTPVKQVSALDTMDAAQAAAGDVLRFCERQPDACATGARLAGALLGKVQYSLKIGGEYLTSRFGDRETPAGEAPSAPAEATQAKDAPREAMKDPARVPSEPAPRQIRATTPGQSVHPRSPA